MAYKPNYYGLLPASVRYDDELPFGARILYAEITALCKKEGFCYASNRYFANLLLAPSTETNEEGQQKKKSTKTIKLWLAALRERGHIRITYENKEAHRGRRIYITSGEGVMRVPHIIVQVRIVQV